MKGKAQKCSDAELYAIMGNDKENSETAFAELYSRHSARVIAYCNRFLGDKDDALDVFQETFVKFYQSARKERLMTNVPAFLLKIARNLCVNFRRCEKRDLSLDDFVNLKAESNGERDELLNLIKIALDLLPDEYREMFILREYEGMPYSEIAEITNTTIGTVKTRLYRAKNKIRELLTPYLKEFAKYS